MSDLIYSVVASIWVGGAGFGVPEVLRVVGVIGVVGVVGPAGITGLANLYLYFRKLAAIQVDIPDLVQF